MSKSSAFSINAPLIFEIQEVNGALFSNAKGLFISSQSLSSVLTVTIPFTKIYAS